MAQLDTDVVLELPEELVRASPGFSVDIGGSLAKIVYRSRDDYDGGVRKQPQEDGSPGRVRMRVMSRQKIDDIIKLIKDHCDLTPTSAKCPVYVTGVGGSFFIKTIEQQLQVRTKILIEMDCFLSAFMMLSKTLSQEQLFLPEPQSIKEQFQKFKEIKKNFVKAIDEDAVQTKIEGLHDVDTEEAVASDESLFPCIIVICGSGIGFLKISEDGQFSMHGGSMLGGRMFYGLCAALTGVKDMKQLNQMIQTGNGRSVDEFTDELKRQDGGSDLYSAMPDDIPIFHFAKAITNPQETLRPDDMVHSLLRVFAVSIGSEALNQAVRLEVRRIYFCGHFTDIEKAPEFISKGIMFGIGSAKIAPRCDFIRHGGMLGALGAFMEPYRIRRGNNKNNNTAGTDNNTDVPAAK